MPTDFLTLDVSPASDQSSQYAGGTHAQAQSQSTANRQASSVLVTLSRYLLQRRWVWSVQQSAATQITTQAIGRILSTITK